MHRTTITSRLPATIALLAAVTIGCGHEDDREDIARPDPVSADESREEAPADEPSAAPMRTWNPAPRQDAAAPASGAAAPEAALKAELEAEPKAEPAESRALARPAPRRRGPRGRDRLRKKTPGTGDAAWAPPVGGSFEASAEAYDPISENTFIAVSDDPRSTFSIDVDTASYSNVRRFLADGAMPPVDAVRIEELINYFSYDYRAPTDGEPFSMTAEVGACPWNETHRLVHVGLQGEVIDQRALPARNLVFLFDVSGSMNSADKLPLLRRAFSLLVDNLRPRDKVSIVVYAGASGVVLEPTPGSDRGEILAALDRLSAGGSTNGGAGIHSAYAMAEQGFIEGGINRVILATDGDFNVGATSQGDLMRLIEDKRETGVFLSVLGFGRGDLKDATMEMLADKGNGSYAYIDGIDEARKVLVEEAGATLVTIAKDVKLQVEFNPAQVASYRLIGYENRVLAHADFNDDKKDAGEIGAGHSVTALYEVIPAGSAVAPEVDALKYQDAAPLSAAASRDELMTVKIRYKDPDAGRSRLLSFPIDDAERSGSDSSRDFRFSAAVAGFGMLLRGSEHKGDATFASVRALAEQAKGADPHGRRAELVRLIDTAARLSAKSPALGGEFAARGR